VVGAMTKDFKSNVIMCFVFVVGFSLLVLFLIGSIHKEDQKSSYLEELQGLIEEIKIEEPHLTLYRVSVIETKLNTYFVVTYLRSSIKEEVIYDTESKSHFYSSKLDETEKVLYDAIKEEMKDATQVYLYELNQFD
jgi:hypothetical protein